MVSKETVNPWRILLPVSVKISQQMSSYSQWRMLSNLTVTSDTGSGLGSEC